ncbi:TPA: restriction endonuclease subunit S [Yersinia enterocolitica]|nr:restriction endonuclease subunit S [Yersinia enterocolitica]EKN3974229.1 restriction endonuclease subunit S [Yersinia enterocolitica]HEN3404956.1 restriction endonuclease subunit S [Yersinia enterocolitica]
MSEVKLPEGWIDAQLGAVIELKYGKSLPAQSRDGEGYPVYGSNGVVGKHSAPLIKTCGLIIGRKGSYGEVQFSKDAFSPIDTTYFVDELYEQPIKYWFYQLKYLPLTELNRSTAIPGLNREDAYEQKIKLPSLTEQEIIAEKLDTLLALVDSAKARLEEIPQILKRFRQSVLAAAVSGKLTEEWRETQDVAESAEQLFDRWLSNRESNFENSKNKATEKRQTRPNKKFKIPIGPDIEKGKKIEIPSSWKLISVSQFSDCLDNQRIPIRKEDRNVSKGLYPYFGANGEVDKVDNYIFDGDFVLVTEDETFYGREKPIAYRYSGKCWVNNHAHVLSAQTKEANDFLCYTLMYYDVIPWLTGTTGRAKLTQGALNVLPIGLPSEIEILEIVRRVEQLFVYADTIEKQVQSALLRVNNLTQSILAKAFRGELTAQWRAENPDLINGGNSAEALLVRIKQERLKNKPVKRGKGNS